MILLEKRVVESGEKKKDTRTQQNLNPNSTVISNCQLHPNPSPHFVTTSTPPNTPHTPQSSLLHRYFNRPLDSGRIARSWSPAKKKDGIALTGGDRSLEAPRGNLSYGCVPGGDIAP